jgi:hypothetical protein
MNTLNTNTITRRLLIIALAITPMLVFAHGGLEHVHGIIASISDQSVTVTTTAGKTVEVLLDAQTTYAKAEKAIQKSDLKVGDRVVIHAAEKGTTLTARTVEVGTPVSKKP